MKIVKRLFKFLSAVLILSMIALLLLVVHTPEGKYPLDRSLYTSLSSTPNYVKLEQVSTSFTDILVANEDKRFYEHIGIDIKRTLGVAITDIKAGKYVEGGSTISQQLAKNLYYSSDKSLIRKALELGTALRLEYYFTKEQLLEMYINIIYYGSDAYGIKAAAETYYQVQPIELTVEQSAELVGLLPAPSLYNPIANPELSKKRAGEALKVYKNKE